MITHIVVLNQKSEIISSTKKGETFLNLISEIKKGQEKDFGKITYKSKTYQYQTLDFGENKIYSIIDYTQIAQLKKFAWIDQLTGVFNRHAYMKILKIVISNCAREELDLGVIFVDIDNLKNINSTKGYIGGDSTIAGIAKIIYESIRKTDFVVRLGGDEFLILAKFKPNSNTSFKKLVEKIYRNIGNKSEKYSTVSIGGTLVESKVINLLDDSKDMKSEWSKIVSKVDTLVLNAKQSGKDRFKIP